METISLLTCLKLRYPERVQLIRGNHETRAVTQVSLLSSPIASLDARDVIKERTDERAMVRGPGPARLKDVKYRNVENPALSRGLG